MEETGPDIFPSDWQANMIANLVFLTRGEEVLLIHKKTGLGAGKINGPGGKLEPGETALESAAPGERGTPSHHRSTSGNGGTSL